MHRLLSLLISMTARSTLKHLPTRATVCSLLRHTSPFKMSLLQPFLNTHDRFLVYGSDGGRFLPVCGDCIDVIQKAGFLLTSETKDADGVLYAYERQHHPASQPGPEQNQAIHSRALTSLLLAWPRTIRVTARPHGYSAARRPVRLDPPSASGADSPLYFPT